VGFVVDLVSLEVILFPFSPASFPPMLSANFTFEASVPRDFAPLQPHPLQQTSEELLGLNLTTWPI
jgi:hypothetical protein